MTTPGNQQQRSRRGAALYIMVMGTTMIVSVLGLSALAVVRIERQQAAEVNTRIIAKTHAHSSVELALCAIAKNPNWRTTYSNNVETTPLSLGSNSVGTLSWKLVDSDSSLTNTDTLLRLKGIGRVNSTVQVSSVEIRPEVVGPTLLRSHSNAGPSTDELKNDKWWGQYLKVTLPTDAVGWQVSSVEIYARRKENGRTFHVRLYRPVANTPNSLIDSATLNSSAVSSSWGWHPVTFGGSYWLSPSEAICLTLEAPNHKPIEIQYSGGSVSESNSALIRGNPGWDAFEPSKALRYRIHGHYSTSSGVHPIPGTWLWDAP